LLSELKYQCSNGFPLKKALRFAEDFGIVKPDIIIYLKISPDTSLKRKLQEKNSLDRNEDDKKLQSKIIKSYENLIKNNIFGSWTVINGENPKEKVFAEIKKVLGV
jgi:thymidylate kinase